MVNCERCKEKITLTNLYILQDTESGKTKKYCKSCADIIIRQNEEKRNILGKKGIEERFENITEEPVQKIEKLSEPESELSMMNDTKTEDIENHKMNETITDIVTCDNIVNRINSYLDNEPLNIGKDEYCYIKVVENHLEIGRAKISLMK